MSHPREERNQARKQGVRRRIDDGRLTEDLRVGEGEKNNYIGRVWGVHLTNGIRTVGTQGNKLKTLHPNPGTKF